MYNKEYYLTHREEILARAKKWREEHPEQYKKALKRCVAKNRDKYNSQKKIYFMRNWEKIYQQQKKHYLENREHILERVKQYRKQNSEKIRLYGLRLRTKKKFSNINGWTVSYEIQNGCFRWVAIKGNCKITDEREHGFPTLHTAQKNAMSLLG